MSTELDQSGWNGACSATCPRPSQRQSLAPVAARVLAGTERACRLLLDPHVRSYLLRPGMPDPTAGGHLLADRREGDPDRPLIFTNEDLPLDILDVKKASDIAQKTLMLIKTSAELQAAAVDDAQ